MIANLARLIGWIGLCLVAASAIAQVASSPNSAGATFKDCANCPELVAVPAGTFTMGSSVNEPGRFDDEGPQHLVTIPAPIAVGKLPVTVEQFAAFVEETGYDAGSRCYTLLENNWSEVIGRTWRNPGFAQTGAHPVVCVNWADAKAYTAWLSKKTGKPYRLLTEAEWEYAARAGTTTRFYFGENDEDFCRYGNGADQTVKATYPTWTVLPCDDHQLYAAPAGRFAPNAFGLYDMLGNAWQWVEDCYNETYKGAPTDGSAWLTGDCDSRVMRGGSWASNPRHLRSAVRIGGDTDVRGNSRVGFRVVRALGP